MPPTRTLRDRPRRIAATALAAMAITFVGAMYWAPVGSADVTIGANVNQVTSESGTCGFISAAERPCLLVTSVIPGQTMVAPCNGTITRFRLNGFPRPTNHYSLRVVRRNPDGSFTGTATSAAVAIGVEGDNEYPTSLPILAGELIGIDFLDSLEEHGLRWVGGSAVSAAYFYDFPADGGSAVPTGPATFYYLFNADIACATPSSSPTPSPAPTPAPSNQFKIVKLKGKSLTIELASAGKVALADATTKAKAGAAAASKAKPKLLKPSGVSGGPGLVKANLKLTGAAKKVLQEKGRVKVKARVTFTPTGGTASTQVRGLTVRKPKAAK